MWMQNYNPLHATGWSALVAAVPILLFLVLLTAVRLTGLKSALATLVVTLGLGAGVFHMPFGKAVWAAVYGVLNGLWPIGWIVLMAVWLYRIAVRAGRFDVIRASISNICADQRIQVLIIAYCFGAFIEGAAGFGIPIAICSALLVSLGFKPLRAAMLSLVANAAAGSYGAIGIPVIVGAQRSGVDAHQLNVTMVLVTGIVTFAVPFILMLSMGGLRSLRETLPATLVAGGTMAVLQALVLIVLGPELADIIPSLAALLAVALLCRRWQPKNTHREPDAPVLAEGDTASLGLRAVATAWSPFIILSAFILVWSIPAVEHLMAPGGALGATTLNIHMPQITGTVIRHAPIAAKDAPMAATWTVSLLGAAGTAILLAALVTVLVTPTITWRAAGEELGGAVKQLYKPVTMICMVMAVANVMAFAGMSSALGLGLAAVGSVFPLISPIIGWVGVFVTGSVVNNNTLFANLQAVTGSQIGISPTLMVASNTAGGLMAKVVSPQSIAIAAAAVGSAGKEGRITNMAIKYSLGLLVFTCVWVYVLSLIW